MRRVIAGAGLAVALAACAQAALQNAQPPAPGGDPAAGFEDWLRAAERGDAAAQYQVGLAYATGREIGRDLAEAARWFRRAAEQDHADAQNELGRMHAEGWGVPRDDDEAMRWFRRAAEQGNAQAEGNVGLMYSQGRSVPQDDVEAAKWLRRAADKGLAAAQRQLGQLYANGRGVPRDDIQAVTWFRRAAEQADGWAQRNLGAMYSAGRGVPQNDDAAVTWWRRGAQQDDPEAQNNLGWGYLNARGVPQDHGEAVVWFRQAARQDLADAQYNLGLMYESGRGVPKDLEEAARWYRRAADQGQQDAQAALGFFIEHGRGGVQPDPIRAYLWYNLAGAQGHATSIERREALSGRMTPAQLDEARALTPHVKLGHEALAIKIAPPPSPAASSSPSQPTPAQPGGLVPRAALFVSQRPWAPQLSPDGRRLAYLAPSNGVQNIWSRTVGHRDDRPVTREVERDIRHFRWQCDSEHLLFWHDQDGGERWRLYQLDLESETTRDLTPPAGAWVALGAYEACDAARDTVLVTVFPGRSVHRADLRAGTLAPDAENPGDVVEWMTDSNLQVRAALAWTPSGETVVRVRDNGKSPWRVLQRWRAGETGHFIGFTPDGRSLLLTSSVDAPAVRLLRVDIATGSSVVIAEDPRHDIADVMAHSDVQAVRFVRARTDWTFLDRSTSASSAESVTATSMS